MDLFKIVRGYVIMALTVLLHEILSFVSILLFDEASPFEGFSLILFKVTYILYVPIVVIYIVQPYKSESIKKGLFLILLLLILIFGLAIVAVFSADGSWFEF